MGLEKMIRILEISVIQTQLTEINDEIKKLHWYQFFKRRILEKKKKDIINKLRVIGQNI